MSLPLKKIKPLLNITCLLFAINSFADLKTRSHNPEVMSQNWLDDSAEKSSVLSNDIKNIKLIHKHYWNKLNSSEQRQFKPIEKLKNVQEIKTQISELRANELLHVVPYIRNLKSLLLEHDCTNEVGYGLGGDYSPDSNPFETDGIMLNNYFPLKHYRTCVRDQGYRGTCVSFATLGAWETLIAKKTNTFVNLSEQQFYYHAEIDIDKDGNEGLIVYDTLKELLTEGYEPSLESTWDYNQSMYRDDFSGDSYFPFFDFDGDDYDYKGVCVGYTKKSASVRTLLGSTGGQACSETVHQGQYAYRSHGKDYYTGPSNPEPYPISELISIWDETNEDASIENAISFLNSGYPIILSFAVVNSFDNPNGGYVINKDETDVRGGHAVLVLGYVSAEDAPTHTPSISGGYFVVKNSWGEGFGDQGYVYLSTNYIKNYTVAMDIIKPEF